MNKSVHSFESISVNPEPCRWRSLLQNPYKKGDGVPANVTTIFHHPPRPYDLNEYVPPSLMLLYTNNNQHVDYARTYSVQCYCTLHHSDVRSRLTTNFQIRRAPIEPRRIIVIALTRYRTPYAFPGPIADHNSSVSKSPAWLLYVTNTTTTVILLKLAVICTPNTSCVWYVYTWSEGKLPQGGKSIVLKRGGKGTLSGQLILANCVQLFPLIVIVKTYFIYFFTYHLHDLGRNTKRKAFTIINKNSLFLLKFPTIKHSLNLNDATAR